MLHLMCITFFMNDVLSLMDYDELFVDYMRATLSSLVIIHRLYGEDYSARNLVIFYLVRNYYSKSLEIFFSLIYRFYL